MVRRPLVFAAIPFTFLTATACQDLLGLTAGTTGGTTTTSGGGGATGGTTGGGGHTGGGGTGATSTTGGTGGELPCGPDCKSSDCKKAECVAGVCEYTLFPAGQIVQDPTPGDCKADLCDGEGNLVQGAPRDDDADDGVECTWDACGGGLVGHAPKAEGTPCSGGLCQSGACVPAVCDDGNAIQDTGETDLNCGGLCSPCELGKKCKRNADCASGWCSTGLCTEPIALAMAVSTYSTDAHLVYGQFDPAANPPWTTLLPGSVYTQLGASQIAFDSHGEGVGVIRQGGAQTLQWARWKTSTGWTGKGQWMLGDQGAAANYFPAMATTDDALTLFIESTNLQHFQSKVGDNTLGAYELVPETTSAFSGNAVARQGHVSFFYADGTARLVERRYLGGAWSPPLTALEGNYSDAQPAVTSIPGIGALLVALRRQPSGEHTFDWLLLPDSGPPQTGTLGAPAFAASATPPRRFAIAPRAQGGAIFAYRKVDAANSTFSLDVWTADVSPGAVAWTQALGGGTPQNAPLANLEPSLARGIATADAELLFVSPSPNAAVRHFRLSKLGTWTVNEAIVATATTTVSIATP
ncbi:MAG: hypothetical protein U0441_05965 [Polyangiaceae bacterium]